MVDRLSTALCKQFLLGIASVVSVLGQSWCISQRSPLFSATFTPLSTVIVAIMAAIFLHEQIYIGSLVGAIAVITGLYVVLWGRAEDIKVIKQEEADPEIQNDQRSTRQDPSCEPSQRNAVKDLKEPLTSDRSVVSNKGKGNMNEM
ncbi:putative Nodulin MtN21 /EamA-like transporter family protein [Tripterygium wilfordii]|uniref:Putative Nodulin MtN21 /EamA-like transporter family protein n=1 Tax=Tripterygium wilfordii TaxID=458696 RepID=A0A7J7BWA5_TRIWF|nr:putative Nodulin MtN21 /EamA-like transporter family protein [Tripterygium wilfordii]